MTRPAVTQHASQEKGIEMDAIRRFHRRRKMFFYVSGNLIVADHGDSRTHYDWALQDHNIKESVASKLTRGYYLDGKIVLYRGDFYESEEILKELENGLMRILIDALGSGDADEVWMGAEPGEPGQVWKPKTFIGTCGSLV